MNRLRTITIGSALAVGLLLGAASPAGAVSLSGFIAANQRLAADLGAIGDASNAGDLAGLQDACVDLGVDAIVIDGYQRPRAISRTAWRHIQTSVGYYTDASFACVNGTDGYGDADLIEEATRLLALGVDETNLATAALR